MPSSAGACGKACSASPSGWAATLLPARAEFTRGPDGRTTRLVVMPVDGRDGLQIDPIRHPVSGQMQAADITIISAAGTAAPAT